MRAVEYERSDLDARAAVHAALGEPTRLAIADALRCCDRSPSELGELLDIGSNLLSFHLDTLEAAGVVSRSASHGDRRRRYVRLNHAAIASLTPPANASGVDALFVCTHNSARSQLAAALWEQMTDGHASSAGTDPAYEVHPGAVAAAQRAKLPALTAKPRSLASVKRLPPVVITVCDQAHESLPDRGWLHWSVADPTVEPRAKAFDATVAELRERIAGFAPRRAV